MVREQNELLGALSSDDGRDLLSALPLIAAHIHSAPVVIALRALCDELVPPIASALDRDIMVAAFGSIGRLEYVPGFSDLDCMIVVDGTLSEDEVVAVRRAILTPLAEKTPWIACDHRREVLAGKWNEIPNAGLPFPVLTIEELLGSADETVAQRRWQLLLEGRSLFNDNFFSALFRAALPAVRRSRDLMEEQGPPTDDPDFRGLTRAVKSLFGSFDNPQFLYKSPFKYFKTRFLRDFFVFGVQLDLVLGWYRLQHKESLGPRYIRAATVTRFTRALRFARELDSEASRNPELNYHYREDIRDILKSYGVQEPPLLLFGNHRKTESGRLLHGLLMSVLSRFSSCWELLYDAHVRDVLHDLPVTVNPESRFRQPVLSQEQADTLVELQDRRDSYRRYMRASASVIQAVFPKGRVWMNFTVPGWVGEALEPFTK